MYRSLDKLKHGGIEDGYFSVLVSGINGIFSGIGCVLTIYIILRSESRLADTYHRIMFAVSIVGIMLVCVGSLSYLLFPQNDELLEWPYFIRENILRLGSTISCNVQGAVSVGGYFMYQAYISMLLFYYFCAIILRMKSYTITKWVEPFLHLIPISTGLVAVSWGLYTQSFNPHPTMPWCSFIRYPATCPDHCWAPDDEGCECIRSNPEQDYLFNKKFIPAMLFVFSGIDFFCLIAISIRFFRNHLELKSCHAKLKGTEPESDELIQLRFRESSTRVAFFQAFLYSLVLIALFVTAVLCQSYGSGPIYDVVNGIRIFVVTLQGFVYYAIFLYIKVHNLRVIEPHLSGWKAIQKVHKASPDDRVILVGLNDVSVQTRNFVSFDVELMRRPGNVSRSQSPAYQGNHYVDSIKTPSGATISGSARVENVLNHSFETVEGRQHDIMSEISPSSQSLGSMYSYQKDEFDASHNDDFDDNMNHQ